MFFWSAKLRTPKMGRTIAGYLGIGILIGLLIAGDASSSRGFWMAAIIVSLVALVAELASEIVRPRIFNRHESTDFGFGIFLVFTLFVLTGMLSVGVLIGLAFAQYVF